MANTLLFHLSLTHKLVMISYKNRKSRSYKVFIVCAMSNSNNDMVKKLYFTKYN